MKNILITGANGMLGQDLVSCLKEKSYNIIETDIHNMDITDEASVITFLSETSPDVVIHTAAYTTVDKAEEDKDKAFLINGKGSENLAKATAKLDIPIFAISTDYVFDGTKTIPYLPTDKTSPQTVYGESKLAGEVAIQKYNPKHYIARTSWLYGHKGKNFVETMIDLSKKMPELKVVNDQKGCPTWTVDLSKTIINILEKGMPYGIYHTCGAGQTTWYDFTLKIFELMKITTPVKACSSEEFTCPAKRPAYSVMNNGGLLRNWEEALIDYINLRSN
ncbi:MAG: dTDP-4-dehydrorhamnose reductase [Candidatus Gastranaerophilales bacterium]|nr:dTDP-4-dehydrorhamnose reductase [Candidatus Gastranaerophilales bacterium]